MEQEKHKPLSQQYVRLTLCIFIEQEEANKQ